MRVDQAGQQDRAPRVDHAHAGDGGAHEASKPRRRGDALTGAICLAPLEELARTGLEPLAFDRIAAVAGAGEASLYRRWATPAEPVPAALTDPLTGFGEPTPEPAAGTLRGDLVELLTGLARVLEQPHGRALRPLVAQRERRPELHARVVALVWSRGLGCCCARRSGARRTRRRSRQGWRRWGRGWCSPSTTTGDRCPPPRRGAIVDEVLLPLAAPRKRA
ncbi:TetR/AcrR family transcriptional regulator C-terminal ligand-binding domain-containing protein [Actinosynnema sp.]|uniref:TetR/AcrR family transcriptional regulator C-terminal ligand-binding domain-containing protein n=1 Tax=Actinosynnema sp. TaxID=1872144 RepID=UPI003F835209